MGVGKVVIDIQGSWLTRGNAQDGIYPDGMHPENNLAQNVSNATVKKYGTHTLYLHSHMYLLL